jgi:hypothetical protein
MKALMLDMSGPPGALQIQDLPILTPGPEQVLIKGAAFALCGPVERGPEWHHLPHRNTRVVGRPATVGVAAQPIQTVC